MKTDRTIMRQVHHHRQTCDVHFFFFPSKTIHAKFEVFLCYIHGFGYSLNSNILHSCFVVAYNVDDVELYIDGWWIKLNSGTHFDALHIKRRGVRESNWRTG